MDGPKLDFSPLPLACLTQDWHSQGKSAMLKGEKCRNERKTTIPVAASDGVGEFRSRRVRHFGLHDVSL
jgi:hypothetical protein